MSTVSAPEPSPRAARPRATRQKAAVDRALDRIPDIAYGRGALHGPSTAVEDAADFLDDPAGGRRH